MANPLTLIFENQYGIEHVLNGVPLEKLVTTHFKWQPGWVYVFE